MARRRKWLRLILLLLVIGGGLLFAQWLGLDVRQITPDRIRTYVLSFGMWAPLVYFLIYAQPIIPLPASIMTMAAGIAFGLSRGMVYAVAGATVRACGQFLLVRGLGREAVAGLLRGRLATLDQWVKGRALSTVIWVRVIPNVPFDMQNFALGFSQVSFAAFALGTFLGLLPGLFAWVYLGHALSDPKHLWKAFAAIAILAGLWFLRRRSSTRRPRTSSE